MCVYVYTVQLRNRAVAILCHNKCESAILSNKLLRTDRNGCVCQYDIAVAMAVVLVYIYINIILQAYTDVQHVRVCALELRKT